MKSEKYYPRSQIVSLNLEKYESNLSGIKKKFFWGGGSNTGKKCLFKCLQAWQFKTNV